MGRPRSTGDRFALREHVANQEIQERSQERLKQQQRRVARLKQQQLWDNAVNELAMYGFQDREAVDTALQRFGPGDLKSCVRFLMENERSQKLKRQQKRFADRSPSPSPSLSPSDVASGSVDSDGHESGDLESSSSSSDSHASSNSTSEASSFASSFASEDDEETSCNTCGYNCDGKCDAPSMSFDADDNGPEEEANQFSAHVVTCLAEIEKIRSEAQHEEAQVDPQILVAQPRQCRMLNGVPFDLLSHEENLLKLLIKLDNVNLMDACDEERSVVRSVRKGVVKTIQNRIDKIDACRRWWFNVDKTILVPA